MCFDAANSWKPRCELNSLDFYHVGNLRIIFFIISYLFLLVKKESGCLLPSLPSDAIFDQDTGISFTCDLNDNIPAPWPSSSSSSASTCKKRACLLGSTIFFISFVL